jgi:hypothetical protein
MKQTLRARSGLGGREYVTRRSEGAHTSHHIWVVSSAELQRRLPHHPAASRSPSSSRPKPWADQHAAPLLRHHRSPSPPSPPHRQLARDQLFLDHTSDALSLRLVLNDSSSRSRLLEGALGGFATISPLGIVVYLTVTRLNSLRRMVTYSAPSTLVLTAEVCVLDALERPEALDARPPSQTP